MDSFRLPDYRTIDPGTGDFRVPAHSESVKGERFPCLHRNGVNTGD